MPLNPNAQNSVVEAGLTDIIAKPQRDYPHLTQETVTSVRKWTDFLFSFTTTRSSSFRFASGQFTMIGIELDDKPLLRAYSVASPHYDEHLEFLSIAVPDGPLTSRLRHIQVGDIVLVGRKPVGTLLLDNLLPGRNLYLLSTGTGLAPFLSLARDPECYDRFDNVILTHTVRTKAELAFGEDLRTSYSGHELLSDIAAGKLHYYPAVTREPFVNQERITASIRSGRLSSDLSLPPLDPERDRCMLCGSPEMLADTEELLISLGFIEGSSSTPGSYVIEKAFVER